jgi:sugar O-acyltransferase (sialic acid O-acetyltransferase NeuD family)
MYLYGASGHGKVIAEIAEDSGYIIDHYIDKDPSKKQLLGYTVIHDIPKKEIELTISIGNNAIRKKIAEQNPLLNYITLIHPKAIISKRSEIAEGTVIMPGVTINSETKIGKHCIINTNSSIDHDCIIESYAHISPGVSLAGNVSVGEGTHIGIGASVIQGVKIGKWCMIGAGAVIIKDIPDGATVVGNPGRIIKITELT